MQEKSGRPFKSGYPLFYLAAFRKASLFKSGTKKEYFAGPVKADTAAEEYAGKFREVRELIRRGEIYQVNECFKLKFDFKGDAYSFFAGLCKRQEAEYAAFVDDGQRRILSISPELFFSISGRHITMKPMKGTVVKGSKLKGQRSRLELHNDKNKAENIMIVDLIRNDLGKICETNSVAAGPLFEVKEYKTLYQMTSTVKGTLKKDTKLMDLLAALFPSGSVTGAPKIRAMQVIKETEKSARGVYTGAIGYIGPKMKTAVFNIPIRTVVIDNKGKAEMGIGSGIVHDSDAVSEYEECLGKAKFLFPSLQGHLLIESLLLKNGKYYLLNLHLKRLMKSAAFFGVPVDKDEVKRKLLAFGRKLRNGSCKVRLLVDAKGKIKIEETGLPPSANLRRTSVPVSTGQDTCRGRSRAAPTKARQLRNVATSKIMMDSNDTFLRHKTTNRSVYDAEYAKYLKKGFVDVIFFNERGELTEAHSSNVFIKKNGIYYTPPVSCGLLPGTYREMLLEKGGKYREKVLYKKDLMSADSIYICNSVRGMREVVL